MRSYSCSSWQARQSWVKGGVRTAATSLRNSDGSFCSAAAGGYPADVMATRRLKLWETGSCATCESVNHLAMLLRFELFLGASGCTCAVSFLSKELADQYKARSACDKSNVGFHLESYVLVQRKSSRIRFRARLSACTTWRFRILKPPMITFSDATSNGREIASVHPPRGRLG